MRRWRRRFLCTKEKHRREEEAVAATVFVHEMDTHKDEITRRPPATTIKDSVDESIATRSAAQARPPPSQVSRCSDDDGSDTKRIEAALQRPQAVIARPTERQLQQERGERRATWQATRAQQRERDDEAMRKHRQRSHIKALRP